MNIGTNCGGDGGGGLGRGPASSDRVVESWYAIPDIGPGFTITKSTLNTSIANGGYGIAYALSQGAQGAGHNPGNGAGSPGGFGGGGSDWDGNSYGAGGGGYFGGCETAASSNPNNTGPSYGGSPSSEYYVYILGASGVKAMEVRVILDHWVDNHILIL